MNTDETQIWWGETPSSWIH